jgi:1,2-diacylglycerol 3-alpha-glucosyltransferase
MKIGLMVTSIGNFGQKGFYNTQEIGLAKALSVFCDELKVYKLVNENNIESEESIDNCSNAKIYFLPSKLIGNNGFPDFHKLDSSLDILIYFCDTQFAVPKVYKWTKKHNISFYPYIGVINSHSTNKLKKLLVDILFQRNKAIYKKCLCFVKTPTVKKQLDTLGINKSSVIPVGLDTYLLNENYKNISKNELKKEFGYQEKEKVILFIGRFSDEKRPLDMIDIFNLVYQQDNSYRLLMVGNGELYSQVIEKIKALDLYEYIKIIEKIPNEQIWKLYRLCETFANLNKQEIFGMAILEAMFYECKVVAWSAPGPDFIIENGLNGWIVNSDDAMLQKILDQNGFMEEAHKRIRDNFTWKQSAGKIIKLIS